MERITLEEPRAAGIRDTLRDYARQIRDGIARR